jgi:16S rRNA G527 N7-methylase RsmG
LRNFVVVEGRAGIVAREPAFGGRFDASIARAWAALRDFLEVSKHLVVRDGVAIAMKGRHARAEAAAMGDFGVFSPPRVVDYRLPSGGETRVLLVFARR